MRSDSVAAVKVRGERAASHRWKVLGVGFAANASFSAAFSGIPTTAVFLRSGYHLGNEGLGLVLGMLGLGIAVSELPWGLLTDRWGDRRVLLLGATPSSKKMSVRRIRGAIAIVAAVVLAAARQRRVRKRGQTRESETASSEQRGNGESGNGD